MTALLVDWHCHLDRAGGLPALPTTQCQGAGKVETIVMAVTNRPAHWQRLQRLRHPGLVWALGFHPGESHSRDDLARMLDLLDQSDAVGEIGLDGTNGKASLTRQRLALDEILGHPALLTRAVSLHSRRAVPAIIEHLAEHPLPGAVLHWFTGTPSQAARAVAVGAWFSVNANMGRTPALQQIPRERVLLETDAPYGRAKLPGELMGVLSVLSSTWQISVDECAEIVRRNQAALLAVTVRTATAMNGI